MPSTSTIQLQSTVNTAQLFLHSAPLATVGGVANEPAFTIANTVMSLILAPPLAWPWNRSTKEITLVVGTQDYTASIPNFGWLETASVTVNDTTFQLEIKQHLSEESNQQRPNLISVHSTDGEGNWTFRLMAIPDQAYTLTLTYQQVAPLFTGLVQTWSPIPDTLSPLFSLGFRAFSYEYSTDPRWMNTLQLFLTQLANINGGLSDEQKNLFLWTRLRDAREQEEELGAPPAPRRARR